MGASACHGSSCSRSAQRQQIACRRRRRQSGFESLQGRIRVDETSGRRADSCSSQFEGWGGGRGEARGQWRRGVVTGRLLFGQHACSSSEERYTQSACIYSSTSSHLPPPDLLEQVSAGRQGSACSPRLLLRHIVDFFTSVHPSRVLPVAVRAAGGLCRASTAPNRASSPAKQENTASPHCATDQALPSESPTPSRRV